MRLCICICVAALTAVLSAAGPAAADTITLTFGALAAQDGQTIASYTDQGITLQSSLGFTVVGASSPYYTGSVGLIPLSPGWTAYDATGTPYAPAAAPDPLALYEAAEWIAAAGVGTYDLTIQGATLQSTPAGTLAVPVWRDEDTGALTATPAQIFGGSNGPLAELLVTASATPYQITELDLSTGTVGGTDPGTLGSGGSGPGGGGPGSGTTPEPAAALLLAIGAAAAIASSRRRRPR